MAQFYTLEQTHGEIQDILNKDADILLYCCSKSNSFRWETVGMDGRRS